MNHFKVNDHCKKTKSENPKGLIIFALDTVFIDRDIIQSEFPVAIIAPKWKIVGKRTIDLTGFNGDRYKVSSGVEETDVKEPGKNGKSGRPGLPGGPGGIFFGIGQNFINGKSLTISANGGKGGAGEDGENGNFGEDGNSAESAGIDPQRVKCDENLCQSGKLNGLKCDKLVCSKKFFIASLFPEYNCVFHIYGHLGMKGGDGGDGGSGGKGGKAGSITLYEMNDNSGILKYEFDGKVGVNGTGGYGGTGGKHGDNLLMTCHADLLTQTRGHTTIKHTMKRAPRGSIGKSGANSKYIENPKKVKNLFKHLKIIDEYKCYLRENLKNYYGMPTLVKFLNHLENNRGVKKMYDTLGFFNDLDSLEKQFYKLNSGVNFLPFYSSLLDRIQEYAKNPKPAEMTDQYKKARNYLYTAVLCRINDMEKNLESSLIVDIENHLMSVKKDVDKLKDFQTAKNKADVINKYKKEYKKNIDKKIDEAKDLIQKHITPRINDINSRMDKDIESLVRDVADKESEETDQANMLKENQIKLQKSLKIKAIFSVVDFASQAVGYLGPAGQVAGGVIGEINSVAKTLVLDKENMEAKLLQLPESVMNHVRQGKDLVMSMMHEKVNRFNKLLQYASDEIHKNPESFGELSSKINKIQENLHNIDTENFNFRKVSALEKEFQEELLLTKGKINLNKAKDKKITTINEKIDNFCDRFDKVYRFGMGLFELMNTFKGEQSQVDAMTKAIVKSQGEFQMLKDYEESIYNTLSPTLSTMKNDINETEKKLGSKSTVALDVARWQVQSTLRDVKEKIKQMVSGFEENEDLQECIQNLNESMDLLIDVYNHIEDYHKQQHLADYIAEVSSETSNSMSISDPQLDKAVNKLEILVISNLILERYEVSIDAFKQFVFPFAHRYLDDTPLPSFIALDNNLNNLATEVINRIDHMLTNLKVYKYSITDSKNNIGSGKFNSDFLSVKPFFVWKNERYNYLISKFLAGEEVLVKADITKSEVTEDAIKFSILSLNIKSNNATVQNEINNILKAFKINLTHLGNSYYRYNDKIYMIPTSKYDIWYNYERDGDVPTKKSSEYDDIKAGNYMLSPFATWKLKLTNLPNAKNISFSNLEAYKDQIDLELGGYASFVNNDGLKHSELMLDKYYKTIEEDRLIVNSSNSVTSDPESLLEKINAFYHKPKKVNQVNTIHDNSGLSSGSWYNWKLPDLKLLPGAHAFSVDEMNSINQFDWNTFGLPKSKMMKIDVLKDETDHNNFISNGNLPEINSIVDNISSYFGKFVGKVKDTFFTKSTFFYSKSDSIDKPAEKIIFTDHKSKTLPVSDLLNIEFENSDHTSENAMMNSIFIGSNLVLAQLIACKLFGNNELLQSSIYLSPDQERIMKLDNLSKEISFLMKENSVSDQTNDFLQKYKNSQLWYQDLYKDLEEEESKKMFL